VSYRVYELKIRYQKLKMRPGIIKLYFQRIELLQGIKYKKAPGTLKNFSESTLLAFKIKSSSGLSKMGPTTTIHNF